MEKYTAKAPTVEEAIEKGIKTLGIKRESALIEVVDEGKKGIFGIGQKDAIVTVQKEEAEKIDETIFVDNENEPNLRNKEDENTLSSRHLSEEKKALDKHEDSDVDEKNIQHSNKVSGDQEAIDSSSDYLLDIAEKIGAPATVTVDRANDDQLIFHLETQKAGLLIGKHGKILNALQSLVQVLVNHHSENRYTVILNVGDYRERREIVLKQLADRTAEKVRRTNQPVFLEPMPAFERKQIHFYLSKGHGVSTHSEGNEPHRYLVVEPEDNFPVV